MLLLPPDPPPPRGTYPQTLATNYSVAAAQLKWLQSMENTAARLLSGAEFDAVTTSHQFCAIFTGCLYDSQSFSRPPSFGGNASTVLLRRICASYVSVSVKYV